MATLHASLSTFHTPNSGIIPPGGGHIHYFDFFSFFQNILIGGGYIHYFDFLSFSYFFLLFLSKYFDFWQDIFETTYDPAW